MERMGHSIVAHSDIPREYAHCLYWIQAWSIYYPYIAYQIWADSMGSWDPSLCTSTMQLLSSMFFWWAISALWSTILTCMADKRCPLDITHGKCPRSFSPVVIVWPFLPNDLLHNLWLAFFILSFKVGTDMKFPKLPNSLIYLLIWQPYGHPVTCTSHLRLWVICSSRPHNAVNGDYCDLDPEF